MTDAKRQINLETISEEELLNTRICDLPLQIAGTWLQECIRQLYQELEAKGIIFQPSCYLADEWLTPEGETCIGIPFFLAHPTLVKLEKKIMIDAEGETKDWCLQLLRHETGHAICYAYQFQKRRKWRELFGPPSAEYAETYKYRPYSKNYVRHLGGFYAQYHPDEDFVETFAVWLTPQLDWEKEYHGWGALKKLKYVDHLMREIRGREPLVKSQRKFWRLETLKIQLKNYYKKKRHFWAEDFPDFHDAFLNKVFSLPRDDNASLPRAGDLIRKYRRQILNSVERFSGEKKYVVNDLLRDIEKRARNLKLAAGGEESALVIELSAYVSSLIMNYLYTGRFRGQTVQRGMK